jgi:hypothetical protein
VPIYFAQGLYLQVNEVDSDKYGSATYLEFIEAYARTCEAASTVLHFGEEPGDHPAISEEDREKMPLHEKIENTLQYLLHNCTPRAFMEKFEAPKKHPSVGLYILPNKKFF